MVQPGNPADTPNAQHAGPQGPVRTCIGCRQRAARSDLVRVVLDGTQVVLDETATAPGRGAWLHRSPECLDLSVRRKAFPRALRASVADASSLKFG